MKIDFPKHYRLKSDNEDHFLVHDLRDKTDFKVAKKPLHPASQIKVMKMQKFDEGGGAQDLGVMNDPPGSDDHKNWGDDPVNGMLQPQVNAMTSMQNPMLNQLQSGQAPTSPMTQAPVQAPGLQAPGGVDPRTLALGAGSQGEGINVPDPLGELNAAAGLQKQAAQEQYQAQAGKAQADAKMFQDQQVEFQAMKQDHDIRLGLLNQRSDGLFNEASKGNIDPNQYWNSKSTGSKIGITLGMLLSGIGSGLSGQRPMAYDVLQNNINRDIDAQKHNMSQKNNLYRMNLEQTHNEQEAYMMTKADMLTMTAAKANQIAAQMGTPQAAANRDAFLAQIGNQQAMLHQQLAVANIGRQAYTTGVPPQAVPYLHPDQQKRMVRMDSGRMADAGSEANAKEYNESTSAYNSLVSNINQLKQLNTIGSLLSPAAHDQANALIGQITIGLNDFAKSHRISETDLGFQKGQLSSPVSVWNKLSGAGNTGSDQLLSSLKNTHDAVMTQYVPAIGNQKSKASNINFKKN